MDQRFYLGCFVLLFILPPLGYANSFEVTWQSHVKELIDGPHTKYSGQPLVDLGGTNYLFDTTSKAQETCHNLGMFSASIETTEEYQLIRDHLRTLTIPEDIQGLWISANCIVENGTWVWHGTGQPVTWFDWSPGEPRIDACMQLWKAFDWMMDDYWCYASSGILCEEMPA
ncbi:hypothetical protein B566_EDAN019112 [Ephemera danica]|nr:hypothetical protein B566_EDAN019112 [Ephemera danica]